MRIRCDWLYPNVYEKYMLEGCKFKLLSTPWESYKIHKSFTTTNYYNIINKK